MHGVALQRPTSAIHSRPRYAQEPLMLDVVMLALGLGFFVAALGYTYACERL